MIEITERGSTAFRNQAGASRVRSFGILSMTAVALILALPAGAQETTDAAEANTTDPYSDDIVVMARKRAERLIKVPETVSALSSEALAKAGVNTIDDLGRQTPNIILNRRQDNEPNVVIRGVGAFGNTQGVGFYIDDVQNFTDQAAPLRDVERVEILKGPQGTLYGGSNIGGAVKIITKSPTPDLSGEFFTEIGGLNTRNFFGAANVPLIEDKLLVRVSAYSDYFGGFIDNSFLGNKADESREIGVRATLLFQPTENFDISFKYRHSERENGANSYIRSNSITDYRKKIRLNEDPFSKVTVYGGIFQAQYRTGDVEFTSLTSLTRRTSKYLNDLDYSTEDRIIYQSGDRTNSDVFTQEFRVASAGAGDFDWLAGVYTSVVNDRGRTNSVDLTLGADAGGPIILKDYRNFDTREKQYAAFLTANYRIGAFRIGGGLRVDRYEIRGLDLNANTSLKKGRTTLLPKATVAYDFNDDSMFYATFAQGSEPGKINLSSDFGLLPYGSEKARSFEAGFKGRAFDRALTYEIAAFYIPYKNRQFETQIVESSGEIVETIANIGKSNSYGLEGGLTWRATDNLTIGMNGGYLHSEWKTATFNFTDYSGNTTPYAPKWSGGGFVEHNLPLSDDLDLSTRVGVSYQGKFYWDIPNDAREESHALFDFRLALAHKSGWEIAVRGENIFDEDYQREFLYAVFAPAAADGTCAGCHLSTPGQPRRILVSFGAKF